METTQLRPTCTEEAKPLSALAFSALEPLAADLFQLRRAGITVHIPDEIRQDMLANHGDVAARVLSLLDGRLPL